MRLSVNPVSYLVWAFLVLIVPIEWLIASVLAAVFHELCHIVMIWCVGGRISHVTVKPNQAQIHTAPLDPSQELLCSLAGPAGSFLLALFFRWVPQLAVCGVIQGLFNLLPIYPLDGGRAVRCGKVLLQRKKPCKEERFHVQ